VNGRFWSKENERVRVVNGGVAADRDSRLTGPGEEEEEEDTGEGDGMSN
jgi:hypothetical protein